MVEQSDKEFNAQDVTHTVVDRRHRQRTFRDQFAKRQDV